MMTLLTAALFYLLGRAVAARDTDSPFERACYAAIAGSAFWLFTSWLLALMNELSRPLLVIRFIILLIVVGALVWTKRLRIGRIAAENGPFLFVAIPIALAIAFLLWRGSIIPPVSHDALSYHLPKAVLIADARGYEYFDFLIPVVRTLPINYELLLAEEIILSGSDNLTEWVSILFYLFFVVAGGALTERWWGRSSYAAALVSICTAAVPVLILHSGAHKNDVMLAAFMAAALVAGGGWIAEGDIRHLLLTIAAFACAVGTKPQGGLLALAISPFIAARLLREIRGGMPMIRVTAVVAASIIFFLMLGGAVYVNNYAHEGALLDAKENGQTNVDVVPYGDWSNLWQGPYVLVAAPFSSDDRSLNVPWRSRPWFWRRYEIYFSHLGVVWALSALAAPFVSWWSRRLSPERAWERAAVTVSALITFLVMLPVGFKPHGLYAISLPRYALFIVPIVFAWTIGPLTVRLEQRSRAAVLAALAAAVLIFVATFANYAIRDVYAPLQYVLWARDHPGTRVVPFDPNRAASIIDRMAGPRDRVAIDAGYGTWIHPAFGADLKRPVEFIPQGSGPPRISADAKWVAVDRAFTAVFGHPNFRDLSEARTYLLRGRPRADEIRVIEHLRRDPRFELVFYNRQMVQAVFRRIR